MGKNTFPNSISFRLVGPLIIGMVVYLLILMFFDSLSLLEENFFSREVFFTCALSFLFNELNRYICLAFEPVGDAISRSWRIFLQTLAGVIATAITISACLYAYFIFVEGFSVITTELITFNAIYFSLTLLYHLYFFSIQLLEMRNDRLVHIEEQKQQQLEAEVSAYKTQINPGLLFDVLEILIQQLHHDTETADKILSSLSAVYRYRLKMAETELAPLSAEITSIKPLLTIYNFIHSVRFADSIEGNEQVQLVPGTLLALLERAFTESILMPSSAFEIELMAEGSWITFSYPHCPKLRQQPDAGQQLARLSRSYMFFTNEDIREKVQDRRKIIQIPVSKLEELQS